MESNCKTKFNLDHVYCHPTDSNYIRANSGSTEVLSILKENKQLKAMLLLHLDLIQEQSDQLMAKDKLLASLREQNEALKLRLERSDRRLLKNRTNIVEPAVITSPFPSPPPLNSIAVKKETEAVCRVKVINCKSPITNLATVAARPLPAPEMKEASPKPSAAATNTAPETTYKICEEGVKVENIIGEKNGKLITKIYLQRVQTPDRSPRHLIEDAAKPNSGKFDPVVSVSRSPAPRSPAPRSPAPQSPAPRSPAPQSPAPPSSAPIAVENSNRSPLRKRAKSVIVTSKDNADENLSCGSGDREEKFRPQLRRKPAALRPGTMSTSKLYCTREWEGEKVDADLNREESEAMKAENPNLEIPKWRIREFHGLYAIEGTEDLSDEVFLKRHNKLEIDERRRKKWDVQRIREQRTIERLKRRHMKEEPIQETQFERSFFPPPESIKCIQISDEIPVNAFGESIPLIKDEPFRLPWPEPNFSTASAGVATAARSASKSPNPVVASTSTAESHFTTAAVVKTTSSSVSIENVLNSSLLLIKNRRRQNSQNASSSRRMYRRTAAAATKN